MKHIRTRHLFAVLIVAAALGCDKTLTVEPTTEVEANQAIIDAGSARAALAGAYDALQSSYYYRDDFLLVPDLASDNAEHTGTFTTYGDIDQFMTTAANSDIEGMWDVIYDGIGRANTILARVPTVTGLDDEEKNDILGQAYLLRALHYHNLVKLWGAVPIRTVPPEGIADLANTERAPVEQVYTQILSDLQKAQSLITSEGDSRRGSVSAVAALRSRVALYRKDWAGTIAAADAVIDEGFELAPNFSSLFTADGNDTPEDIWRVSFTAVEYTNVPYYYLSRSYGGRREIAPTDDLIAAFESGDTRGEWSIAEDNRGRIYGSKFPDAAGAEDLHVIRFAEVLLNKAEAQARLGDLTGAVETYNLIRERAGLPAHVLGTEVTTQSEVIDAVLNERRKELAFEGDRWPDLVRTGQAMTVLGIPAFRLLFPIPQNEVDVAPRIVQNPGY